MPRIARAVLTLPVLLFACAEPTPRADTTVATPATPVSFEKAPDESFTDGAVTINYKSLGSGEPMLLVHGYGDNLGMWASIADSLGPTYRRIAMDVRGFGKSSKPAGQDNYGLAMVDDMLKLLDHVGVQRAHVVGFSMGAALAANFALLHPDRVATVTLASGPFLASQAATRTLIEPWVKDVMTGHRLETLIRQIAPSIPDSLVRPFSDATFAASDSAALLGALQGFEDLTVDWAKVVSAAVPAVVISGEKDPLLAYSRAIAAKWPGAKLVEIPGADHGSLPATPELLGEIRNIAARYPIAPR